MIELASPDAMQAWSRATRGTGKRIGFVPTMGFLHEGHLRLVDRARRKADAVVMSVFVNPIQFGPKEDFSRYPRDLPRDRDAARSRDVECLFVPDALAMYPHEPAVRISPGKLADHLCGPRRPGHFDGVLTVVAKLLNIVTPHVAEFGRKDVQQALMVRRMAADLNLGVEIDIVPTVRERDGLALSSRNVYLDAAGRLAAPVLAQALDAAAAAYVHGERDASKLIAISRATIHAEPLIQIEYVEAVDPEMLAPVAAAGDDTLLALAARIGHTRLIDNIVLGQGTAGDDRL